MPIKLLAIDDDEGIIDIMNIILTRNKIVPEFELFRDENKLLDALTPNVQICVIDYRLKCISGNELIRKIMATNPYCWFIMMSGHKDPDIIIEFINQCYGTRYLEKGTKDFMEQFIFFVKDIVRRIGIIESFFYEHRLRSMEMKASVSKLKDSINELKDNI